MHCDNTNKDPFVAFQALAQIDRTVQFFIEESKEGELGEKAIDFLHDLRLYCRSIYYKEPEEIEKAKSLVAKEEEDSE